MCYMIEKHNGLMITIITMYVPGSVYLENCLMKPSGMV